MSDYDMTDIFSRIVFTISVPYKARLGPPRLNVYALFHNLRRNTTHIFRRDCVTESTCCIAQNSFYRNRENLKL